MKCYFPLLTIKNFDSKKSQEENQNQNIIIEKIQKSNGEISIKKYEKGKILGKGGFAKCYEFTNLETNKISAAKIIPKTALLQTRAR